MVNDKPTSEDEENHRFLLQGDTDGFRVLHVFPIRNSACVCSFICPFSPLNVHSDVSLVRNHGAGAVAGDTELTVTQWGPTPDRVSLLITSKKVVHRNYSSNHVSSNCKWYEGEADGKGDQNPVGEGGGLLTRRGSDQRRANRTRKGRVWGPRGIQGTVWVKARDGKEWGLGVLSTLEEGAVN